MPLLVLVTMLAAHPHLDEARLSTLFGFRGVAQRLDCRVLGTMLSATFSLASIECGAKVRTVAEGDEVEGTVVIGIERERVLVERDGAQLAIERAVNPAPRPLRRLSAVQLATAVEHPEALRSQSHLIPAFDGSGKAIGFRATWVKEGSLVAALGLRQGDVLKKVNGVALDQPWRAMQMIPTLMTAQRFEVEIDRDGAPLTETVTLTR